jgi:hypothetical protein
MEQYWMPKELDFKNLRQCLDEYPQETLYVRLVGSMGGTVNVDRNLQKTPLDFRKNRSGLHLLIGNEEVFCFPLKNYYKGFSLAYERVESTGDGHGRIVMLSTGVDPYDQSLPEPRRSILRNVLDNHLIEIAFTGRINLRFHSWMNKPDWKYWTVNHPGSIEE